MEPSSLLLAALAWGEGFGGARGRWRAGAAFIGRRERAWTITVRERPCSPDATPPDSWLTGEVHPLEGARQSGPENEQVISQMPGATCTGLTRKAFG